jgi:hypothetical protein
VLTSGSKRAENRSGDHSSARLASSAGPRSAALRLMKARDEVAQIKRTRLQDMIDRGYEDVATGKVIRLENDDEIDAFFADL